MVIEAHGKNTNLVIERRAARTAARVCALGLAGAQRQTEALGRRGLGAHLGVLGGELVKAT